MSLYEEFRNYEKEFTGTMLDDMAAKQHQTALDKGFWQDPVYMDKVAAKLALIHSEVTEVLEALRKNKGTDKVTEEFADIIIRTLSLHARLVEDGLADAGLHQAVLDKMVVNDARPAMHGHRWG